VSGPLRHRHGITALHKKFRRRKKYGLGKFGALCRVLDRTVIDDDEWKWTVPGRPEHGRAHQHAFVLRGYKPELLAERALFGPLRAAGRLRRNGTGAIAEQESAKRERRRERKEPA